METEAYIDHAKRQFVLSDGTVITNLFIQRTDMRWDHQSGLRGNRASVVTVEAEWVEPQGAVYAPSQPHVATVWYAHDTMTWEARCRCGFTASVTAESGQDIHDYIKMHVDKPSFDQTIRERTKAIRDRFMK